MNPNLYEYRPPIDLSNTRLRKLAPALGPTYVRVSGTWANTTYFYDANGPARTTPRKGFSGVLGSSARGHTTFESVVRLKGHARESIEKLACLAPNRAPGMSYRAIARELNR